LGKRNSVAFILDFPKGIYFCPSRTVAEFFQLFGEHSQKGASSDPKVLNWQWFAKSLPALQYLLQQSQILAVFPAHHGRHQGGH